MLLVNHNILMSSAEINIEKDIKAMNLIQKIDLTREIFSRCLGLGNPENIFASWTGGKDSTVLIHQWASFLREIDPLMRAKALNLDTGYKFPEIIEFRNKMAMKWQINLLIIRPQVNDQKTAINESKVECCRKLKIEPLKKAVRENSVQALLTGIRRDEHASRLNAETLEEKTDPRYWQINPIAHWTEMDIWSYIVSRSLPYCSLYDQGYRSLGCMPCTARDSDSHERAGRDPEKESSLNLLRSMGYF